MVCSPLAQLQEMHGGEPTSYFGERSLMTSAAAVASVTAIEESDLLCLHKGAFESLLMHGTEKELIASQVRQPRQPHQPRSVLSSLVRRALLIGPTDSPPPPNHSPNWQVSERDHVLKEKSST